MNQSNTAVMLFEFGKKGVNAIMTRCAKGSQVYSATGSTEYILTEDLKEATVEIVCFRNCSSTIIEKKIQVSSASINRCVCGMLDRWTKRCFQLKIHQLEELSSDRWR